MKTKQFERALVGASVACVVVAGSMLATADPGGTIDTPGPPDVLPAFLFEPEVTFDSLKSVALWRELEQMLDRPYRQQLCPGRR